MATSKSGTRPPKKGGLAPNVKLKNEAVTNYESNTIKGKGDSKKQAIAKSIKNEGGLGAKKKKK